MLRGVIFFVDFEIIGVFYGVDDCLSMKCMNFLFLKLYFLHA
jgi:hypothetical protein